MIDLREHYKSIKCATCPISTGCSWECLRADDLCEIAELRAAAQAVIDETHRIHDNSPWPQKYRAPYGAIVKLGEVLKRGNH